MSNKIEKFEDLRIWQEAIDLSVEIYSSFADCKVFAIRDQVIKSSLSIPSNIAEGFDRQSNNEFIRFLRIAKGSCAELRTQLIICEKIGLLSNSELIETTKNLSAMIQKMVSYRLTLKNN